MACSVHRPKLWLCSFGKADLASEKPCAEDQQRQERPSHRHWEWETDGIRVVSTPKHSLTRHLNLGWIEAEPERRNFGLAWQLKREENPPFVC